jgi:hypothetical protein
MLNQFRFLLKPLSIEKNYGDTGNIKFDTSLFFSIHLDQSPSHTLNEKVEKAKQKNSSSHIFLLK